MKQKLQKFSLIILYMLSLTGTYAIASLNISLESIDGNNHQLTEYIGHGKWTVLNIWGTKCPPCQEEVPELVSFHDEHKGKDAIVVGIAIDFPSYGYANKSEVIAFAEDYLIDFPILLSDASITEKMGLGQLRGLPSTFIFDPSGKIAGMQVGGISKKIIETFIKEQIKKTLKTKHKIKHKTKEE